MQKCRVEERSRDGQVDGPNRMLEQRRAKVSSEPRRRMTRPRHVVVHQRDESIKITIVIILLARVRVIIITV